MTVVSLAQTCRHSYPGLDLLGEVGGGQQVVQDHRDRVLLHLRVADDNKTISQCPGQN